MQISTQGNTFYTKLPTIISHICSKLLLTILTGEEPKFYEATIERKKKSASTSIMSISHIQLWLLQIFQYLWEKKEENIQSNRNLQSMSINNWFPLEAPAHPNHIISVRYFTMDCARCAWAYITTAEIYCGHVRWCSFLIFWVFRWLRPSCIAVGCDQQLVRRVVTPPAQHHAGTEHAQHLQADRKGRKEKLLRESLYPSVNLAGK